MWDGMGRIKGGFRSRCLGLGFLIDVVFFSVFCGFFGFFFSILFFYRISCLFVLRGFIVR